MVHNLHLFLLHLPTLPCVYKFMYVQSVHQGRGINSPEQKSIKRLGCPLISINRLEKSVWTYFINLQFISFKVHMVRLSIEFHQWLLPHQICKQYLIPCSAQCSCVYLFIFRVSELWWFPLYKIQCSFGHSLCQIACKSYYLFSNIFYYFNSLNYILRIFIILLP